MAFQGGGPRAPAAITVAQIKNAGDLSFMRIDKANAPQHVFNNALINSAFEFWQRGNGPFTVSSANGSAYGPDRGMIFNTGPNGSAACSRATISPGEAPTLSRNGVNISCTGHTGTSDGAFWQQPVEGCETFSTRRVVFRGLLRQNSGPNGAKIAFSARVVFGNGGSAEISVVPVLGQQVQLSIGTFVPFAAIFDMPSIAGKVIGTNDFVGVQMWLSAGSDRNALTGNLGLQSIGVTLMDYEFKEIKPGYGDTFPGYERIPKALDQINSFRFYEQGPFDLLLDSRGYNVGETIFFQGRKRTNPVTSMAVAYNPNGVTGVIRTLGDNCCQVYGLSGTAFELAGTYYASSEY